jgi:two-component system, NtrC family, response regulator AtoC
MAATTTLRLLVVGRARMESFKLPVAGEVTIGRAEGCDVRIDDPSVGAEHAVLRIGRPLVLVDLGSGSPTKVASEVLAPGTSLSLAPGVVFSVGAVTLVVQKSGFSARLHPIRSHDYFEARVEDECARVAQAGGAFAVARFLLRRGAEIVAEEVFTAALRPMDVVASYTPNEYEALILDVTPARAREIAGDLASRMRDKGAIVEVGLACYPADARTPETLLAALSESLHGGGRAVEGSIVPPEGAMEKLRPLVERVASSTISVLILGETGVGKEVMATTIHALSPRAKRPMVSINCAAVSENLLESELFGYERGAFTGAVVSKAGLLETAEGGTVFLDEIGEMTLSVQAKLLRVLEHKQVARLGALTPRAIDVRFVAATNRDLEEQVERGAFRRDLYFRLAVFTLSIPPLRERIAEIAPLANGFIRDACAHAGRTQLPRLGADVLATLEQYAWPGNVRELRNVLERAVLLCPGDVIELTHLPLDKMGRTLPTRWSTPPDPFHPAPLPTGFGAAGASRLPSTPPPSMRPSRVPPPGSYAAMEERERIIRALDACAGNQTKAAQLLGIARRTLISRIEMYNLPRPKKDA